MILRQLFDQDSSTYTYIVADKKSRHACIIDPVLEKTKHYIALLKELELNLVVALDTHIHADHITALGKLRELTGCETMVGLAGDVNCASKSLEDCLEVLVGELAIKALFTPGHTAESFCFYLDTKRESYIFTGDTLLIRGTGRTDFQNGDAGALYDSLHKKLLTLPLETIVLPGHDYKGWTSSTLGEEKNHNPRLKLGSKAAFIEHMNNLNLPNPKMMDIAVPANLTCGKLGAKHA